MASSFLSNITAVGTTLIDGRPIIVDNVKNIVLNFFSDSVNTKGSGVKAGSGTSSGFAVTSDFSVKAVRLYVGGSAGGGFAKVLSTTNDQGWNSTTAPSSPLYAGIESSTSQGILPVGTTAYVTKDFVLEFLVVSGRYCGFEFPSGLNGFAQLFGTLA